MKEAGLVKRDKAKCHPMAEAKAAGDQLTEETAPEFNPLPRGLKKFSLGYCKGDRRSDQ